MFRRDESGFLVYDPFLREKDVNVVKKHKCADCFFCQMCAESRCNVCRGRAEDVKCKNSKLKIRDQIELFERIN